MKDNSSKKIWHRELPCDYREKISGAENLIFLFQFENIFVMDNHLGAGWAWLNYLDKNKSYNFLHIDSHSDLLYIQNEKAFGRIKNCHCPTLDEYIGFRSKLKETDLFDIQTFKYDTYIRGIHKVIPKWFSFTVFSCEDENDTIARTENNEINIGCFLSREKINNELKNVINKHLDKHWIINIDIDYFWNSYENKFYPDEFIKTLAKNIVNLKEKAIITIALSPECCKSWENAIILYKKFIEHFPQTTKEHLDIID